MRLGFLFAKTSMVLLAVPALLAQNPTATLVGTVRDSSGAVVVGAALDVRASDTGQTRHALANERGEFTVPNLVPGPYEITITKQGFPLIRYRTGDLSSIVEGACPCGRTLARMRRLAGRIDDMIIVDGGNIFPSQIEDVILKVEGIEPHYRIVIDREDSSDTVEVQAEVSDDFPFLDEAAKVAGLRSRLQARLDETLGIRTRVSFVERKTIERSEGSKLRRVVDKRPK